MTWDACDKTCGAGVKKRTRSKQREKQHGGDECMGNSYEINTCNTADCRKLHFMNYLIYFCSDDCNKAKLLTHQLFIL